MKKIELTIKFDPTWILDNLVKGNTKIIEEVLETTKEQYSGDSVLVVKKDFHQCKVIIASERLIVKAEIERCLKGTISYISDDAEIDIDVREIDDEEFKRTLGSIRENLKKDDIELIKGKFGKDLFEEVEKIAEEEEAKRKGEKIPEIDSMIAMDPVKKWVEETDLLAKTHGEFVIKSDVMSNFAFLMSINRGNGLSTALEIMAYSLEKNKFFTFQGKRKIIEWTLEYDEHPDRFPSLDELLQTIVRSEEGGPFRGIVALNIEEWIDYLYDKRIDRILDLVCDTKGGIMFVVVLPYADDDIIEKIAARFGDVINIRTMKFIPPSDTQYFEYFLKIFEKYEIKISDDVFDSFVSKMTEEKNDGRFYGFNTVKKLADEIIYKMVVNAARQGGGIPKILVAEDIIKMCGFEEDNALSGIEELSNMIALEEVKNKVQEIISTVKLQKELYNSGGAVLKPCFHMMFSGNPGTGKTVVARIIGRIFKEEGLLPIGNFFEVSRKDFVGKFVGHTAPKTMELCRSALGSVLFIDEAYMLADERDGFSSEAIGTLIAEMENNRDKMVIIFAGYEKELQELFDMNPGLKDRIPHKINFPNYNREELKQIFFLQMKNKMKYDASFEEKATEFFMNFPEEVMQLRDFSNGRFVRNIVERIISKAALRFELSGTDISDFYLTRSDFEVATSDSDFKTLFSKVKKANSIGF